jgi:two-component system, OmpR family, KDP operon response regulator KdpE
MTTVLVVDDQLPLLRSLEKNLRQGGYEVELATTGSQALARAERHLADAVILDLDLPDIGGMRVLTRIRGWSTVPVIVLSACAAQIQKVAALDAGASDYLTKPFCMDELMARLRAILRHRRPGPDKPAVVTQHFTVDLAAEQVTRGGRAVRLTRTEWRIVALLARHPGALITQRQLLAEVWGVTDAHHGNYVRVFLVAIRRKLEPDPAHPRYFITEHGCGVRFLPGAGLAPSRAQPTGLSRPLRGGVRAPLRTGERQPRTQPSPGRDSRRPAAILPGAG